MSTASTLCALIVLTLPFHPLFPPQFINNIIIKIHLYLDLKFLLNYHSFKKECARKALREVLRLLCTGKCLPTLFMLRLAGRYHRDNVPLLLNPMSPDISQ